MYLLFLNRKGIHPAKFNMEPKYEGFLFNWVMFKFHVNFQGCTRNGSSRDFSVMPMHICSDFWWDDVGDLRHPGSDKATWTWSFPKKLGRRMINDKWWMMNDKWWKISDENDDDDDGDDDCKTGQITQIAPECTVRVSVSHNFTQWFDHQPHGLRRRCFGILLCPWWIWLPTTCKPRSKGTFLSKQIFAPIMIIQPVTIIPMEPKLGAKMGTKKKLLGVFTLTFNDFLSTSPPKKKKHDLFGMAITYFLVVSGFHTPNQRLWWCFKLRYATCFPTSQMDFTSRFTKQHGSHGFWGV